LNKIISLHSIFILFIFPITKVFLFAQQDSSNNRVLINPNIRITDPSRLDLRNSESRTFPPQVQNRIQLKILRDKIQVGEEINLIASLTPPNPRANYRFYLENSNWTTGFMSQSQIYLNNLDSVGTYTYGVEVSFPQIIRRLNNPLKDTIKIKVDSIDIDVHPTVVEIGEEVHLGVKYNTVAENVGCRFFFYGNNNPPGDWNGFKSNFRYESPGTYIVYAEIGKFDGEYVYASYQTRKKIVKIINPTNVTISINKDNPLVGEDVIFTARSNTERNDVKYIFYLLGDRLTGNQGQNSVRHIFNEVGNYTVRVELLTLNNQMLASASKNFEIYPEGSFPNWLIYVLIVLGLVSLGTATLKWYFKPAITLHPKLDFGKQVLSSDKKFSIDLEFKLKFNLPNSKYQIKTKDSKFVESIRRI
jgi:hypothetical protein